MPDNFAANFTAGVNAARTRLDYDARMQELKSQEAYRRIQERWAVEQLNSLIQKNAEAVQYKADMTNALQTSMLQMSPVIPAPGAMGGVLPNPFQTTEEKALLQNVGPVIGKYQPEKFPSFVQDMAMLPYRKALTEQVGQPRPRTPEQIEADKELTHTRKANAELAEEKLHQLKEGKSAPYAPSEAEKLVRFFESRGMKFSQEQLQKYAEVVMKLAPMAGTQPNKAAAITGVFRELRKDIKNRAVSDDELTKQAARIVDGIYKMAESNTSAPESGQPSQGKSFSKGTRARQNGVIYEYDGQQWNPVK